MLFARNQAVFHVGSLSYTLPKEAQSEQLARFIRRLKVQTEPVAEFDAQLWGRMVDYVTVGVDKGITVVFRDGTAVQI